MKKSLTLLLICLTSSLAFSQNWGDDYCIDFDDQENRDHLFIDTLNYPGNIWQIGHPWKVAFDSAQSAPNVIVTDTINSYPVNNNSAFIIKDLATEGMIMGIEVFWGYYNVQTDSLNDYGKIEFSPDKGITWYDLIADTLYRASWEWFSYEPVLTGNSGGWKFFEILMYDIASVFDIHIGDTVMYKFSFVSDSIPENLDGIMYDNLCFWEFIEGISEIRFKPIETSIYPNPSSSNFMIKFKNPQDDSFQLNVYNARSKLMFSKEGVNGTTVGFGKENLPAGIYFYKLTNSNRNERGWGKFIVTE
jgi:hypothetical protein